MLTSQLLKITAVCGYDFRQTQLVAARPRNRHADGAATWSCSFIRRAMTQPFTVFLPRHPGKAHTLPFYPLVFFLLWPRRYWAIVDAPLFDVFFFSNVPACSEGENTEHTPMCPSKNVQLGCIQALWFQREGMPQLPNTGGKKETTFSSKLLPKNSILLSIRSEWTDTFAISFLDSM